MAAENGGEGTVTTTMERRERPIDPWQKPREPGEEQGPERPDVDSGRDNLLKRMRQVDPKQAERYRQRTGQ